MSVPVCCATERNGRDLQKHDRRKRIEEQERPQMRQMNITRDMVEKMPSVPSAEPPRPVTQVAKL